MKSLQRSQPLNDLVGYQLRMLSLRFDEAARAALVPYGISPAKVTALALISANPGCDQSALGRALSVNRASVMKIVNLLEAADLVERRPGVTLRSNSLHLTAKGKCELPLMLDALAQSDKHVIERMSHQERSTLERLSSGSTLAINQPACDRL